MLIKFHCPVCQHRLRADSVHAGRRATCSRCKQPVTVPETSTVNGDDKAAPADAEPIEPSAEVSGVAAVVPIEEPDAKKEHGVEVPGDAAPRPAVSPEARGETALDRAPETPALLRVPPTTSAPAPSSASQKAAAPAFITFNCPGCGRKIGFPAHLPGTPANCPACHLAIMIPEKSGGESFVIGGVPPPPDASQAPKAQPARQGNAPRHASSPGHVVKLPSLPPHGRSAHVQGPDVHVPDAAAEKHGSRRRIAALWVTLIAGLAVLAAIAIAGPRLRRWLAGGGTALATATASPAGTAERTGARDAPGAQGDGVSEPSAGLGAPPTSWTGLSVPPSLAETSAGPAGGRDTPGLPATAAPDGSAVDPVEPLEIRPATAEPTADLAALLAMKDKKNNRGDDDDEEPAARKPPAAPRTSGGGIEKAIDRLANPQPEPKPADKPQRQAAGPAAKVAPTPLACEKCMGTKFLPLASFTPYVHLEKDGWPNPAAAVPWQYCPQCQSGKDGATLVQAETERLKTALEQHKKLQDQTRQTLLYAETRHVAIHAQLPEGSLRRVAAMLETLAAHLEQATLTTVLTQTRPNTHELVIFSDVQAYGAHHSGGGRKSEQDERHKQVFVVSQGLQRPPENMALFKLGRMLMAEATDGKAPAWLMEGFAAYCENAVTRRNLCYPQTAPGDDFKYGESWDAALKRLAAQNKLPALERFFPLSRTNMSVTDYMASYSLVACLLKSSPRNFARFALEVRNGVPAGDALERVYGRSPKDMQAVWAQWVQSR